MEAERRFGAWGVGRRVGQAMTGRRLGPLRLDLKRVGRQRIERAFAWVLLLLLPAAAGVLSPPLAGQAADPLMVVVNPRNAAAVSMSKSELKKILLGDQTNWPNGSAIVLVLPAAGNPDRTRVLHVYCDMDEKVFTRRQLQASFTGGTPVAIKEAGSAAEVKGAVRANSTAVGFLHKHDVDESVKAVFAVE